jgi:hypothetical protein
MRVLLLWGAAITAYLAWEPCGDLVRDFSVLRRAERECAELGLDEARRLARALWVEPLLSGTLYLTATGFALVVLVVAS